jgi:hypothetical protein
MRAQHADPESISAVSLRMMDSGLALRAPRNDDGERQPRDWLCHCPRRGMFFSSNATAMDPDLSLWPCGKTAGLFRAWQGPAQRDKHGERAFAGGMPAACLKKWLRTACFGSKSA